MKKIFVALSGVASLLLLSSILLVSCKKDITDLINLPSNPGDTSIESPAFTAIGTPVGNPVTKNMGPGGGSISSDDGIIQLTIPAGALSVNTDITIQPITNECPGGIGLGYDLLPNGTKFKIPVTIIFHYSDDDLAGTDPYLLFTAYQDSISEWLADIIYRDVDTIAKTLTKDIMHFSGHVIGSGAQLIGDPNQLAKGKISNVRAVNILTPPASTSGGSGDDLATLGVSKPLTNVKDWKVNGKLGGSTTDGTISGNESNATYIAPASIAEKRTVSVSATCAINSPVQLYTKGKKVRTITNTNSFPVFGKITLLPSYTFNVRILFEAFGTNECIIDHYTDSASMQIDIENDEVTISNILNYAPDTKPTSGPNKDELETCNWQKDPIGSVNIETATGSVSPLGDIPPGELKLVVINCNGSGSFPRWEVVATGVPTTFTGGQTLPSVPPAFKFHLTDGTQTSTFSTPPSQTGYSNTTKITIERVK